MRTFAALLLGLGLGLAGASSSQAGGKPSISKEPFGTAGGKAVERYTLVNGDLRVRILTYGGILQTVETPDRHGRRANITLGFATLDGYVSSGNPAYFGALIGRYGKIRTPCTAATPVSTSGCGARPRSSARPPWRCGCPT
jgi:aldose 1-epimerase